nr:hypothetical protein [Tanacetum cinerariifolium]
MSVRSLRLTCTLAGGLIAGYLFTPFTCAATPVEVVAPGPDIPTLQSMRGVTPPDPSGTEGGRKVDLMGDFISGIIRQLPSGENTALMIVLYRAIEPQGSDAVPSRQSMRKCTDDPSHCQGFRP